MPRLRTDDAPRKLRAVWLGPAGHTLPFQWTYVQWAITLIAVPVAATIGTAIVWFLFGDPVWAFGIGGLWFGAGGVYLAVRLMRNVTFDEPLSYQRRLFEGEFSRQFSRAVGARQIAVEFEVPSFGYLSPAVRRSMGWDVAAQRPLSAAERPTQTNPYVTKPSRQTSVKVVTQSGSETSRPGSPGEHRRRANPYLTTSLHRPPLER